MNDSPMTAPEQLAQAICERFDHLTLARLRDVKNAEAISARLMQALRSRPGDFRQKLHDFVMLDAAGIFRMSPPGHETSMVAAGVINSFLKYAVCISQDMELSEIRGGRMETWYDDIPQGFLQGAVGQDHGSIQQQVGRRLN